MTEIVSSPRLARSSVNRVASPTGRISICRPSVSWSSEVRLDLLEDLDVVRARAVEPEHGRRAGRPRALDREPHPVADRRVLGLAGAPDVAGLDLVLDQRVAGAVDDPDAPVGGDLERLVVAAVLLGLLRHQADVRRRAHRRRVERAVLAAEVDRLGVQRRVAVVGDDRLGVLLVALRVPQLARRADHRRHRRVDDHVARDVQVRDPAVGVHHREVRPGLERLLDRRPDRVALVLRQLVERGQDRAEAVVRARAERSPARRGAR